MKCIEFQKRISLLVDGEIEQSESDRIEGHLRVCPPCREFHERVRVLARDLAAMPPVLASPALVKRVERKIAGARRGEVRHPAWASVPVFALMVLLAVGMGNLAGRSVTEHLTMDVPEAALETLVPDQSFYADIAQEFGPEENGR